MESYKKLIVWQKAHELNIKIFRVANQFPKTDEARIVKNQLLRSCSSTPANIIEGSAGEKGDKTFRNHLLIAKRSAAETEYWLLVTKELKYLPKKTCDEFISLNGECMALLTNFLKKF
ncbi:MAG: four helix bundle protein [Patescibacteria group bacterium]